MAGPDFVHRPPARRQIAKEGLAKALNRVLFHPIGLDLRKERAADEFALRMVSPRQVAALQTEIGMIADRFISQQTPFLSNPGPDALVRMIGDFFVLYADKAVADNTGGNQFNDSLWDYLLVRIIDPQLIVESGCHKGHTAWLFRQACPEAAIHCFDPTFANLVHRDPANQYHEHDWMEADIRAMDPARGICFFDDHVNQARRVREAYDRGFRILLFDDDLPAHALYGTSAPPAPTIKMLFDEDLKPGARLEWLRNGKKRSYVFTEEDTFGARGLIAAHAMTPDLAPVTRYRRQSGLTVVRLVD